MLQNDHKSNQNIPGHPTDNEVTSPETGFSTLTCLCLLELPEMVQMHEHVNLI